MIGELLMEKYKYIDAILTLIAIVIVILLLISQETAWPAILIYWIINTIKNLIISHELKKLKNILITALACITAVILSLHGNPWQAIFFYWIVIIFRFERPLDIDEFLGIILMLAAICVNIAYFISISSWLPVFIYWSIIVLKNIMVIKDHKEREEMS